MTFVSFLNDHEGLPEIGKHTPEKMVHMYRLLQEALRGTSAFTIEQREMLSVYTSANNSCSYCSGSHSAGLEVLGVDPVILEQMIEDLDSSPVEEKLKPVLRYVKKLTLTPYKMVQSDADAVYAAGWDSDALSDAIFVCGIFNLINRLVMGHGVSGGIPKELMLEEVAQWLKAGGSYIPESFRE